MTHNVPFSSTRGKGLCRIQERFFGRHGLSASRWGDVTVRLGQDTRRVLPNIRRRFPNPFLFARERPDSRTVGVRRYLSRVLRSVAFYGFGRCHRNRAIPDRGRVGPNMQVASTRLIRKRAVFGRFRLGWGSVGHSWAPRSLTSTRVGQRSRAPVGSVRPASAPLPTARPRKIRASAPGRGA